MLLDLRSPEEFREAHIKNAINFPAVNISRDQVFGSLHRFKNKTDKLIVVYSDDERHGTQQAKIIFEKGFDNVYLLSGGIFVFASEEFGPQMLEGTNVTKYVQSVTGELNKRK